MSRVETGEGGGPKGQRMISVDHCDPADSAFFRLSSAWKFEWTRPTPSMWLYLPVVVLSSRQAHTATDSMRGPAALQSDFQLYSNGEFQLYSLVIKVVCLLVARPPLVA